jgi:hypothetical protein
MHLKILGKIQNKPNPKPLGRRIKIKNRAEFNKM